MVILQVFVAQIGCSCKEFFDIVVVFSGDVADIFLQVVQVLVNVVAVAGDKISALSDGDEMLGDGLVALVAHNHDCRLCTVDVLDKLVDPVCQVVEAGRVCDVVDKDGDVCASIEVLDQGVETLLAGGVPYLQEDLHVV